MMTRRQRMASRRRPALQQVSFRREERTVFGHSVNTKFHFAVCLSSDNASLCFQWLILTSFLHLRNCIFSPSVLLDLNTENV